MLSLLQNLLCGHRHDFPAPFMLRQIKVIIMGKLFPSVVYDRCESVRVCVCVGPCGNLMSVRLHSSARAPSNEPGRSRRLLMWSFTLLPWSQRITCYKPEEKSKDWVWVTNKYNGAKKNIFYFSDVYISGQFFQTSAMLVEVTSEQIRPLSQTPLMSAAQYMSVFHTTSSGSLRTHSCSTRSHILENIKSKLQITKITENLWRIFSLVQRILLNADLLSQELNCKSCT